MVNEEITFSWNGYNIGEGRDYIYKDLQPLEWLLCFADSLHEEANGWEEDCDPNFFEDHFEDCKEECPDISKREMFSEAVSFVTEGFLHIFWFHDLKDFKREIEALRENILKAFENSVIFPDIFRSVGIIEFVSRLVEECLDNFWYDVHYFIADSPEEAEKYFGRRAAKMWKREAELTEEDYEKAFEGIAEFFRTMQKRQFSQRLRESAWIIEGYCKLKAGSEKYTQTEVKLAKRYKQAYCSYEFAEKELLKADPVLKTITDKQAYDYLQEHGFKGEDDYVLPNYDTWQRYVRRGRRKYGTQKNAPRTGRGYGRSVIKPDQIQSISEISSQYTEED